MPAAKYKTLTEERNMQRTTCGLLSALLVIALSQVASATLVTTFSENFDGSNGSWTKGNFGGGHEAASAGDYIEGNNGWVNQNGLLHHHVIGNPGNGGADIRAGVGLTQGLGNSWDGCSTGCGSAHATNVGDTSTVVASVLTRTGGQFNGNGELLLGNDSMLDGAAEYSYRIFINGDSSGSLTTLINNGGAQIQFGTQSVSDWYMLRLTVTDVGTAGETAIAEIADVDDTTGVPNTAFSMLGTFNPSGGTTALTHVGVTSSGITAGASLKPFDNVLVQMLVVPEPATLSLLGMGAMGLMRRRR